MRNTIAAGAVLLLGISSGVTGLGNCRVHKDYTIAGNNYCDAVKHIHYTSVSRTAKYNKVVSMDGCKKGSQQMGGPMAPFNEEVSMHFEGPLHLKRFAVYTPGSNKKRSEKTGVHQRRHNHQHFHQHNKEIREIQDRAVGDPVTQTMNGKVETWTNVYDGAGAATPAPFAPVAANKVVDSPSSVAKAPSAAPSYNAGTGSWGRQAYYSAAEGTAEGLVFLNTGRWNASLDFASADGSGHAASPQTLKDVVIEDGKQLVVMSDKPCLKDECGAVRADSVAHHGFDGAEKAFLMEFSMPITGKRGVPDERGNLVLLDKPGIWMLNAQIPRTGQFGSCNCWTSGCGEFDLFEVLTEGMDRAKSTFHMDVRGGNSDYFERPTTSPITVVVVLAGDSSSAHIRILDGGHNFDQTLSASAIEDFCTDDDATSTFDVTTLKDGLYPS